MTDSTESSQAAYAEHKPKMAQFAARRTEPFDEEAARKLGQEGQLLSLLSGAMQLPGALEGQLWLMVGQAIVEKGGQGIEIDGIKWSLLDVLLAAATHADGEYPFLMLADVMLAFETPIAEVGTETISALDLFAMTHEKWSEMEDLKARARVHMKFGYALMTMTPAHDLAVDQFLAARAADPASPASELLKKIVQENGPVESRDGVKVSLDGDQLVVSAGSKPTSSSGGTKKKQMEVEEEDQGSMLPYIVGGAALVVGVVAAFTILRRSS